MTFAQLHAISMLNTYTNMHNPSMPSALQLHTECTFTNRSWHTCTQLPPTAHLSQWRVASLQQIAALCIIAALPLTQHVRQTWCMQCMATAASFSSSSWHHLEAAALSCQPAAKRDFCFYECSNDACLVGGKAVDEKVAALPAAAPEASANGHAAAADAVARDTTTPEPGQVRICSLLLSMLTCQHACCRGQQFTNADRLMVYSHSAAPYFCKLAHSGQLAKGSSAAAILQ